MGFVVFSNHHLPRRNEIFGENGLQVPKFNILSRAGRLLITVTFLMLRSVVMLFLLPSSPQNLIQIDIYISPLSKNTAHNGMLVNPQAKTNTFKTNA